MIFITFERKWCNWTELWSIASVLASISPQISDNYQTAHSVLRLTTFNIWDFNMKSYFSFHAVYIKRGEIVLDVAIIAASSVTTQNKWNRRKMEHGGKVEHCVFRKQHDRCGSVVASAWFPSLANAAWHIKIKIIDDHIINCCCV